MKKHFLVGILIAGLMLMTACASNGGNTPTDSQPNQQTKPTANETQAPSAQETQAPSETQGTVAVNHVNKINISINPEVNVITDDEGKVTEIECVNEDAETAYGDLALEGLSVSEATELMIEAAASHEFLQDGKTITLTLIDTNLAGQDTLDELTNMKVATQKELQDQEFANSPIQAAIDLEQVEEEDHTCDLCFGSGLLVCDGCNGTTFLDGLAWTVCGKCAGEGKTTCTLCEGAGKMNCDSCGGTGLDASQADGKCFGCHGEGKMNCPRCQNGSGYQECEDCHGEGKLGGLPCPRCGGTLWAVCNRCNGSGERN